MATRDLMIQIKKVRDSSPTMACIRADGSRTWGRMHPFFPAHDLTHFAVESVMNCGEAFFGLIAQGWEIDDFAIPGVAQRLPFQALWVENVVMLVERGHLPDETALNEHLDLLRTSHEQAFRVTADQWQQIGEVRAARLNQWSELPGGATLELAFTVQC